MDIMKREVKKKIPVCHGCLSSDRRISHIHDNSELFFSLLGDQHSFTINDTNDIMLCWECIAMLRKIKTFQNCIRNAQIILLQSFYHMNEQHTLSTLTHIHKDCYDVTIEEDSNSEKEMKDEIDFDDDIKQEQTELTDADEIYNILAKEETNYSDSENIPDIQDEIRLVKQEERKRKKPNKYNVTKSYSMKPYLKYATVCEGKKIDFNNISQYFDQVYVGESEMEMLKKRDSQCLSFNRCPYKCHSCKVGYKRRIDLNRHNAYNHNELPPYKCSQCNITRNSSADLKEHWRIHSALFKCITCGNLSRNKADCKKHLKIKHSKIYNCNSCNETFSDMLGFTNHYKEAHERFTCDYCNKTTASKGRMETHILSTHMPPICNICNKRYTTYGGLQVHRRMDHPHLTRTHKGGAGRSETAYCVECDKYFASENRYKRHISQAATHTPRKRVRVPCPECGQIFSRKNYMNNHYNLMHAKETKFHCEICNKFFARGSGLRLHKKHVHEKMSLPKTIVCEICGRGFSTKRILDNHRRTHTGERPFKCDYCPAAFAQKFAMKTHQKTQHKNVLACNLQMDVQ